jgi:hypothetical protein
MQDIRIDSNGDFRCWNCGGKNFLGKRTGRAHIIGFATLGVGALATKKKLKCQVCNQYNQVGKAKEFKDPLGREYQKERLAEQDDANPTATSHIQSLVATASNDASADNSRKTIEVPSAEPEFNVADELGKLADLRDRGVLSEEEFEKQKMKLLE